ncbi:MAG: DUF2182 domain-containing protein [Methylomonas sp.]|jgi:predicted metal-binding membrane protein
MRANTLRVQKTFIFLLLTGISVVTWRYMVSMDQAMNMDNMAGAWMPPPSGQAWSTNDFINTFNMWIIMMAAMMTPSVIHMALGFIRIYKKRNPNRSAYLGSLYFVLGYFLIWLVFCVAMTALQWQLHELAVLTPMMESRNIIFSALVLVLAGLYQVTEFKAVCLAHCREAHYIREDCHSSPIGMGLHHGFYCVGACWALMLIMFAVGVMNLMWMGLITFMVVLEKIFPLKPVWLDYVSGLALVIWGCYLLVTPDLLARFDLFFLKAGNRFFN